MSGLPPPSGSPPPEQIDLAGIGAVELAPLVGEICRRYRSEFADEEDRYGEAGVAWCEHDNRWLLAWAVLEITYGGGLFERNLAWLADVLAARDFPRERLARDLEIAAQVVGERLGEHGGELACVLLAGAGAVADAQR